ncbi:Uma2 family endonuclease [Aliterella atlantica]|uniref:Putative restriction endonuclease domain-containing protein n=1 Tax=Aliterella atlantica CENA595 TaxID=1618023 RepID=A0A0D8ZVE6_9CYAN|nr:Uma2 family endonuclease [Aliterella atlantica]KJH72444.1 hypothetical protein UH38_06640 [Aliterella atlantica CENA595]
MQVQLTYISFPDYLKAEESSKVRHEYLNGQIFAMTGGSREHNLITLNIGTRLRTHLRGKSCQVFVSDMKVRIEKDDVTYYPDVVVTCNPQDREKFFLTKPCLIVEVLSPSTESIDRREKLMAYRKLEDLQEYVIVSQDNVEVEIYQKDPQGNWSRQILGRNDLINLNSVDLQLAMTEVYEDVITF